MNTQLMISALRQGKTGNQILSILDVITSDRDADAAGGYAALSDADRVDGFVSVPELNVTAQPTLEEIAF